jgi:hypothetical protein
VVEPTSAVAAQAQAAPYRAMQKRPGRCASVLVFVQRGSESCCDRDRPQDWHVEADEYLELVT